MADELKPYTPTWRDWLVAYAGQQLGDTRQSHQFARGLLGNSTGEGPLLGLGALDAVPLAGSLFGVQDEYALGGSVQDMMVAGLPIPGARAAGVAKRAMKKAALANRAAKKAATKAELDPHGISGVKLDKPYTDIEYTRVPSMPLAPQNVMTPEQFFARWKGGAILPTPGDKAGAGFDVKSVEGVPVNVRAYGGGAFPRLGMGGIWASDKGQSTRLSRQIEKTQQKYDTDKVLISHASMKPTGIDFSHHPAQVIAQQMPHSPITRAGAKAVKERMATGVLETSSKGSKRYTYPDFPGINSPKLEEWLMASGNRRKHFVQLMDNAEMQRLGVPSVGAARLSTTDIDQLGAPWFGSGMHISHAQPGLLTSGPQHPSFPVKTPGTYEGSLGRYVPYDVMYNNWYRANVGTKQNLNRAFEWGGADRAQPIDQQWLDQLMRWWSGPR